MKSGEAVGDDMLVTQMRWITVRWNDRKLWDEVSLRRKHVHSRGLGTEAFTAHPFSGTTLPGQ